MYILDRVPSGKCFSASVFQGNVFLGGVRIPKMTVACVNFSNKAIGEKMLDFVYDFSTIMIRVSCNDQMLTS